jgi:hypothetical protein
MGVKPLKTSSGVVNQFQSGDLLDQAVMPFVSVSARAPVSDVTVPASYSAIIASDYEIVLGHVTELGSNAVMEVL